MKFYVQWSRSNPRDWEEIRSGDSWSRLKKKPDPRTDPSRPLDNTKGWVNALCVQGVTFQADHLAVEDINDEPGAEPGLRVYAWNDDPDNTPPGSENAQFWEFYPFSPDQYGAWN